MKLKMWRIAALLTISLFSTFTFAQTNFTVRPSEYSGSPGYNNPTEAYDGNLSTASSVELVQLGLGAISRIETWYGFPSAPIGATGMQLNINSAAATGHDGTAEVSYSLDGGTTFTILYVLPLSYETHSKQTNAIPISDGQDLTKVRIKAQATANVGIAGQEASSSQWIYEIWISGTD
jgi:hypothetical protein